MRAGSDFAWPALPLYLAIAMARGNMNQAAYWLLIPPPPFYAPPTPKRLLEKSIR